MEARTIWRIENPTTGTGMWYNDKGEFAPVITKLTEGISAHLPMENNPVHRLHGKHWHSGVVSYESLKNWFSKRDTEELISMGYVLYEIVTEEYNELEFEILFTKEGIVSQREINLLEVFV